MPTENEIKEFFEAIDNNDIDQIRASIRRGSEIVNTAYNGKTPATKAAWVGHAAVIKELADAGVNFNVWEESSGHSPALSATLIADASVIKALVDAGTDFNAPDPISGSTPATIATRIGHTGAIRALADAGVDLNAQDRHGNTPSDYAFIRESPDVLINLIMHGANIDRGNPKIDSRHLEAINATDQLLIDNNVENFIEYLRTNRVDITNFLEIISKYSQIESQYRESMLESIEEYRNNTKYMRKANSIVPGLLYDMKMITSPINYNYISGKEDPSMKEEYLQKELGEGEEMNAFTEMSRFYERNPLCKPENFLLGFLCSPDYKKEREEMLKNPDACKKVIELLNSAKQNPELFSRKEAEKISALYDLPQIREVSAETIQRVYRGHKGRQEANKEKTFKGRVKRAIKQIVHPRHIFEDLPGSKPTSRGR